MTVSSEKETLGKLYLWQVALDRIRDLLALRLRCSGQLNLDTALESSQNLRSDSFGLNPAL